MSDVIGKICPYCQTPIKPDEPVVFCFACNIPHHRQCWDEAQGCTTFGCNGQPTTEPANQHARSTEAIDIDVADIKVRYCSNCGSPINERDVYCSTCGIRLENIVLPRNSRIPARSQSVENNTVPRRRISYLLIVIPIVLILGVLSIHIFYTNDEAATGGKTPRVTKQSEDEIDFIKVKKVIQNEGVSGKFSVYLKDLNSGKEYYTFNKNEPFIAAGLVFIPILIEVLDQAEAGYIDWNSRVRIYEQMLVGGTGLLNQKDVGSSYSIDGLTTLMMRYSDNSCANILIDRVGGLQQINGKMESLGLSNTRLNRRLMDTYAMNQGIENYTSAKDMGRLLEIIVNKNLHELLSKPEKDGMELYLPESCTIYHQIGVLSHTYNDVGIIHGPSSDFILVILSNGVSNDVSKRVIGKIVQTVYEDLER